MRSLLSVDLTEHVTHIIDTSLTFHKAPCNFGDFFKTFGVMLKMTLYYDKIFLQEN